MEPHESLLHDHERPIYKDQAIRGVKQTQYLGDCSLNGLPCFFRLAQKLRDEGWIQNIFFDLADLCYSHYFLDGSGKNTQRPGYP